MNRLRFSLALLIALAGLVAVPLSGSASAVLPTPPPITPGVVAPPTGGSNAGLNDVSCPAPGTCVAVGAYLVTVGVNGTYEGLIATLHNGQWTSMQAPLPQNHAALPNEQLYKVSCAGTTCVALGAYTDSSNKSHQMVETLASCLWTATAISTPANTDPTNAPLLTLSCGATNSCALVGDYTGTDTNERGFVDVYNGTWALRDVTLPADAFSPTSATFTALSKLYAVSCSTHLCQAVGLYTVTDGTSRGLAVSITPSGATVNATQLPMGSPPEYEFGELDGVSCAPSGLCAAYGKYVDASSVDHEVVAPAGGGGWAAQPMKTLTAVQANSLPIPQAIHCMDAAAATDCLLSGIYTDTQVPAHYPPFVDELVNNSWSALTVTPPRVISGWSCGSLTFCTGVSQGAGGTNAIVVRGGGTWFTETAPDPSPSVHANGIGPVSCDAPTSCWVVGSTNGTYEGLVEHIVGSTTPPTPPTITLKAPTAPFTLANTAKVTWSAGAGAGLAAIQVHWRSSTATSGLGAWHAPVTVAGSATSWTATGLVRGDDYCFQARARDTNGIYSGWSGVRCIAAPLDDRALAVSAHWVRGKGTAFWNGTVTSSSTLGASLTFAGAQVHRIAVVATKCPTCGTVGVYVGATLVGTVSLKSTTTIHRALIVLAPFSYRTGTVRLKVLTAGKSVQIDGLGISRT